MEPVNPEVASLLMAKEIRRRKLATMPFPEKVKMVVRLQQMVAPILSARGRPVRVWDLEKSGDRK